jgi:hypothetical protein
MKKLIISIFAITLVIAVQAQDQEGTYMYESIYLTPKLDALSTLNANMTAHNKKYHGEGAHAAFVQNVLTGRKTGDMVWVMGPGPFANLDNRPAEGGHDEDWANNVIPHLEDISQSEYWRRDPQQFYTPENNTADKIRIRFYKVKRGQNAAFAEHYGKIIQVFREKKYDVALSLYWNTFPTGNGRNMASVSSITNWADLDEGLPVGTDFNEIHGEGSWDKWIDKLYELTEWTDQEVRQNMPAMSGPEQE